MVRAVSAAGCALGRAAGTAVGSLAARASLLGLKHPLAPVALAYVAGVFGGAFWPPALPWLFGVSFLLAGAALLSRRWQARLLWPLLAAAGWTNLVSRTAIVSPHDLRVVVGEQVELASLRGRLCATPTLRAPPADEGRPWSRSLAFVEAEAVRRQGDWQPAFGRVAVSTPGELSPAFFGGRRVEVFGVIRPPKGPAADGLFDYRAYLRWQGVYYELRAQTTNDWQLLPEPAPPASPPLADRFLAWAQATLERGLPDKTDPEGRRAVDLMLWMTLGSKTTITDEVSEPFMFTGTMHIFAISGLHIALISGILVALLRVLQVPRAVCGWLVIPLFWFYTAATGWQASAIRSAVMMTVVIVGWTLRRPGNLLNSLAGAAFIILLWEPRQLFQASFQLSFFVVLSIALLLPPLELVVNRVLQTDRFLPEELLPRWRRWLGRPLRWLLLSLATSLAAQLGSLPLIAWYFHLFSPVSLLANLVIVPMSGLALTCNLDAVACGSWLPLFTEWFNHAGWFLMAGIDHLSRWLATWPRAYFYVPAPSLATVIAYYVVLAALLSGWLLARQRRLWTGAGAGALLLAGGGYWLAAAPEPQLTVLALNGGSAHYARGSPPGEDLLIDCGSKAEAEFVVKPFLKAQGVNRLRHLVLTHGDLRHVGGYEILSNTFRIEAVCTSHARARSPVYRRIVAGLGDSPRRWVRLQRGQQLAGWTVLHPGQDQHFPQADDNALVLRREWPGARVLLLSDLGPAGQGALLEQAADLRADIVVTGLPARGEPLSDELLAAIEPQLIVVNDAQFPAVERAGARLRERLQRPGWRVVYTSDEGTVTIRFKAQGWELRALSGKALTGAARKGGRGH